VNHAPDNSPARAHTRHEFVIPIRFEQPPVEGETRNISFGGLAFEVPDPQALTLGDVVRFTLQLDDTQTLTLSATLCWRAGKLCGVAFEGLARAQRMTIRALVEDVAAG